MIRCLEMSVVETGLNCHENVNIQFKDWKLFDQKNFDLIECKRASEERVLVGVHWGLLRVASGAKALCLFVSKSRLVK